MAKLVLRKIEMKSKTQDQKKTVVISWIYEEKGLVVHRKTKKKKKVQFFPMPFDPGAWMTKKGYVGGGGYYLGFKRED